MDAVVTGEVFYRLRFAVTAEVVRRSHEDRARGQEHLADHSRLVDVADPYAHIEAMVELRDHPIGETQTQLEEVWDYELGWKSTLAGGHLRTQIDGFYMNYQNFQLNIYNPQTGASNVEGASHAADDGIEAQAQAQFGGFAFDAAGAYVHTSLGNQIIYDTRYPIPLPFQVQGHQLPYAPVLSGNLGVQYAVPVGRGTLTPRLQLSYVGYQWATVYQVAQGPYQPGRDYIPSRGLIDAMLTWSLSSAWELEAFGMNLGNQLYVNYVTSNNVVSNVFLGTPRTYGARLAYHF